MNIEDNTQTPSLNENATTNTTDNKYCECEFPTWEEDENHYLYCLVCGKENEGNYYDYSPSEEAEDPNDYIYENNSIIL